MFFRPHHIHDQMLVITVLSKVFHKPVVSIIFNRLSDKNKKTHKKQNEYVCCGKVHAQISLGNPELKFKYLQRFGVNELPRGMWEVL